MRKLKLDQGAMSTCPFNLSFIHSKIFMKNLEYKKQGSNFPQHMSSAWILCYAWL